MKKVLVTAFEPFAGETINPSFEAMLRIANLEFAGALVQTVGLPVERFKAIESASERLLASRPDVVIMLGEAGGRYRVTPERVAINIDDFRIPDNAGNQPAGEPIVEGGPVGYFSSLPIRPIADRLNKANIPAAISNTAGTYLCNRLFYSLMHLISSEGLPTIAGFIHLPYLHEQVIDKPRDFPSLSRETIVEAVRLAIEASLASVQYSRTA